MGESACSPGYRTGALLGQVGLVTGCGRRDGIGRAVALELARCGADLAVTDLLRLRVGPLKLGDLPEGRWRPLSRDERSALLRAAVS